MNTAALNGQFGISGQLEFGVGKGGLLLATLSSPHAVSTVSLYGGQVLSYRAADQQEDMLFQSEHAIYEEGKAIKGGIPLCWPWFGPDPKARSRPAHGFARISQWQVLEALSLPDGATRLVLGLTLTETTRPLWQGEIEARLEIEVGETLDLRLTTRNLGQHLIEVSQALHTYFRIGDIRQVGVQGLEDKPYIDKLDGNREKVQRGEVRITAETDRIYQDVAGELVIRDAVSHRQVRIQSAGSNSTVIWNPWREGCAKLADLDDQDYHHFICVETANAGRDIVRVMPGADASLSVQYRIVTD